jgi:hypothetical protein
LKSAAAEKDHEFRVADGEQPSRYRGAWCGWCGRGLVRPGPGARGGRGWAAEGAVGPVTGARVACRSATGLGTVVPARMSFVGYTSYAHCTLS